jgi:hypothetical protein
MNRAERRKAAKAATMTPVDVTIKQTEVPKRGLCIVTARLDNPHLLRPFLLTVKDTARGTASAVGHFTTEGTALHGHDVLVRRLTELSPAARANAESAS